MIIDYKLRKNLINLTLHIKIVFINYKDIIYIN